MSEMDQVPGLRRMFPGRWQTGEAARMTKWGDLCSSRGDWLQRVQALGRTRV